MILNIKKEYSINNIISIVFIRNNENTKFLNQLEPSEFKLYDL